MEISEAELVSLTDDVKKVDANQVDDRMKVIEQRLAVLEKAVMSKFLSNTCFKLQFKLYSEIQGNVFQKPSIQFFDMNLYILPYFHYFTFSL